MLYRFSVFEFESERRELTKNGRAVALEPQPARALGCLLAKAGEVVTRDELRAAVWGADTHVDFDRGLAYCLSQIRFALGDSGENPRFVQTLPKKGYRFIAPVVGEAGASGASGATGAAGASGASGASSASGAPEAVPVETRAGSFRQWQVVGYAVLAVAAAIGWFVSRDTAAPAAPVRTVIAVSIFDNETGQAEHDRLVAGLSDLVVARLTALDPDRIAVVGNAPVLRQPRIIRNLNTVAVQIEADYVLLGQLQRGEMGLRFITHFIRLADLAHLKANRLVMPGGGVIGLEDAVVEEFTRAVTGHVLNADANSLK